MERESFVFKKVYFEAIEELKGDIQAEIYEAIFEYVFYDNEPKVYGVTKSVFLLIKADIDSNFAMN